jgi:isoleucyl-tRNA synthetase
VPYTQLLEVDRWALGRLGWLVDRVTKAFDEWNLHLFYQEVHGFCATDLSAFYLNLLKDRLYTELPASRERRSAQTALWEILMALVRLIAPVITFTAEEIWQHCRQLDPRLPQSVQLSDWPEPPAEWADAELLLEWETFMEVHRLAHADDNALEAIKKSGVCENPLEARLDVYVSEDVRQLLGRLGDQLPWLFGVSAVELHDVSEAPGLFSRSDMAVVARRNDADKCERCWMRLPSVGQDQDHPALCSRCAGNVHALEV